jgi:hypothetical protein
MTNALGIVDVPTEIRTALPPASIRTLKPFFLHKLSHKFALLFRTCCCISEQGSLVQSSFVFIPFRYHAVRSEALALAVRITVYAIWKVDANISEEPPAFIFGVGKGNTVS